jgi:hypothetical protein
MLWGCAVCGKQHEHWPDLARDVHFPTRASAQAMGFKVNPRDKPPQVDETLLDEMTRAAASCKQRADKCSSIGLNDLAGAWTRCQADLESTVALRRKYDRMPTQGLTTSCFTGLKDQVETQVVDKGTVTNMFTGEPELPHDTKTDGKKKRGRRVV